MKTIVIHRGPAPDTLRNHLLDQGEGPREALVHLDAAHDRLISVRNTAVIADRPARELKRLERINAKIAEASGELWKILHSEV